MCLCPTVRMPNGWLVGWLTAFSWPEGSCLLENKIQLHKNKNKRTQSSLLFLSVFCSLKSHAVTHICTNVICVMYIEHWWAIFDLKKNGCCLIFTAGEPVVLPWWWRRRLLSLAPALLLRQDRRCPPNSSTLWSSGLRAVAEPSRLSLLSACWAALTREQLTWFTVSFTSGC